ncbi:unnamed protein product [Rotaria magnacalcarata]|uniref:Akirin n=5 Tax=Rotaria magnacalcarata TaxID=392030 RepID=A0A816DZ02_9BILA|nr:unnamed protein product [Rotaria magnacalcarata]CAF1939064.1 unnamed protein product [Rotaria magnacalcarata]CAF2032196.1 unnamed protein product [Rotaria magnacalcarata]CAF2150937.1 unnamed protein product [Rotaria magnacalcarata]
MASCMALKRSFEHDRDSNTNSTPYESRTSSSKRQRRCFPVTVVSSTNDTNSDMSYGNQSVFPDVQPIITADVLLTRIKEEVRRLQRRHQLKAASSDLFNDEHNHTTDSTSLNNLPGHSSSNNQHLLTIKQVNMICARLLKEREEQIREEYDQILSNKLNEQYEGFVRFTQDQLAKRFSELQFSYVS